MIANKILLVFAYMIVLLQTVIGQGSFHNYGGAHNIGYTGGSIFLTGIESAYFNQAGLAKVEKWSVDFGVSQRFFLEELNQISAAAAVKVGKGVFGVTAGQFGFDQYNEQKFGLAYARALSSKINIGGQLDLLRYNISTIGSSNFVTFEFGTVINLSETINLGMHVFSPLNVKVDENTDIGTRLKLGIQYLVSKKVNLFLEFDKNIAFPLDIRAAIAYQVIDQARIFIGASPIQYTYGFGLALNLQSKYKITGAYGTHATLGSIPAFSLSYNHKK